MEKRFYIGARKDFIIGLEVDLDTKTIHDADSIFYNESNQDNIMKVQREGALRMLINYMNKIKVDELTDLVEIFVTDSVSKHILRQTYKHWVAKDGMKKDGTKLDEKELNYWKEFATLYNKIGHMVVIRDMYDANYRSGNKNTKNNPRHSKIYPKYDVANTVMNQFFYDWMMDELDKAYKPEPKSYSAEDVMADFTHAKRA